MALDGKLLCVRITDMYWGSGLSLYFTNTTKSQYWPGANKFGIFLMNLTAELLHDETSSVQPRCQPATVEGESVSQPVTPQPLPIRVKPKREHPQVEQEHHLKSVSKLVILWVQGRILVLRVILPLFLHLNQSFIP